MGFYVLDWTQSLCAVYVKPLFALNFHCDRHRVVLFAA